MRHTRTPTYRTDPELCPCCMRENYLVPVPYPIHLSVCARCLTTESYGHLVFGSLYGLQQYMYDRLYARSVYAEGQAAAAMALVRRMQVDQRLNDSLLDGTDVDICTINRSTYPTEAEIRAVLALPPSATSLDVDNLIRSGSHALLQIHHDDIIPVRLWLQLDVRVHCLC